MSLQQRTNHGPQIGIVLLTALFVYGLVNYKNADLDFVKDKSWLNFPGATAQENGIHFDSLGRVITHQDGSLGQPNPPVNFMGEHLEVIGDFKITATLLDIDKQASIRFYSMPPIIYDQWRFEYPSIDITIDVDAGLLIARIWDGSSSNSMDIRTYKISPESKSIITLENNDNQFYISLNNKVLGSMPDHNIFDKGTIWFGIDSFAQGTGFTLASLFSKAVGTGQVKIISAPVFVRDRSDPNSLQNLADAHPRKLKIGAAVSIGLLFTDEEYRDLALNQFGIWTPENVMKPQFIHPEPDTYMFEEADQIVDIALKNDIIVHGHSLVYHKSNPEWMENSPKGQRQEIMVNHIKNIVSHYKGKVAQWDVVNEALSNKYALYENNGSGLEEHIWFEAMGEKYIDLAFRTAHEADPSAKLYLNDYGLERDGQRWDALVSLVKRLKQRGVPIHGVGFESHIYTDGDYINPEQLEEHMKVLAELGLDSRISEIDVTGDDPQEQINQYKLVLDVCLRQPRCTAYSTWGITDLYGSTTRSDRYPLVYGTSLLWDTEMKTKPAYSALQNRLRSGY